MTKTSDQGKFEGHWAKLECMSIVHIETEGPFDSEDEARDWSRSRLRQMNNQGIDTAYTRRSFYRLDKDGNPIETT